MKNLIAWNTSDYVRQKVQDSVIKLQYCSTSDMVADMLTKPLYTYTETFKRMTRKADSKG